MADIDNPRDGRPEGPAAGEEDAGGPGTSSAGASSATGGSPTRRSSWVLPLLALLLGVALGAGIMSLVSGEGAEESREAGATATDSPTTSAPQEARPTVGDGAVVIPASCLQIADEGQTLNRVLVDGVRAAQDLDASAMSGIVREFGRVQGRLTQLSEDCRAGSGPVSTPGATGDPTATTLVPETPVETTSVG